MGGILEFPGTPRFGIVRKIGQGGMGVVYEVQDRERRLNVALKTLQFVTPAALARFKREFRSISDIVHPNLISLYELFAEDELWFFTMELLQGRDFVSSACSSLMTMSYESSSSSSSVNLFQPEEETLSRVIPLAAPEGSATTAAAAVRSVPAAVDYQHVRAIGRQIAEGLRALHNAGKLHRDLKSSNVLVTPEQRAVVLDFGLAADVEEASSESVSGEVVGTLEYMSPEQLAGKPLTPASDFYSFGVMLYQALTGRMPFPRSGYRALREGVILELPPPRQFAPGLPEDLDLLCCDLLRFDAGSRPPAEEIIGRLEQQFVPQGLAIKAPRVQQAKIAAPAADRIVGRREEEQLLLDAFSVADLGEPAVVLVHGKSGIGKSSLLQRFLSRPELEDALIVKSRCYEQESLPYKAFDSAVDTLFRFLRDQGSLAADLLPRDAAPLFQIFPIFRQLEQPALPSREAVGQGDAQELRRRAFAGFRELLGRIRQHRQLVLCLEDLHWADVESAQLLSALLSPPSPPPVLLLCSFRDGYEQRSEFLKTLLAEDPNRPFRRFDIPLHPLSPSDCIELAGMLLGEQASDDKQRLQRLAQESGGNPFFLGELARSAAHKPGSDVVAIHTSLEEIIWERVSGLPANARHLLHVVAVFGQPIAQADAYQAAGFASRDPAPLSHLRYHKLVRSEGGHELDQVEPFHDRIRETILSRLEPGNLRELHTSLAGTLEKSGRADSETLGFHFEHGGNPAKAVVFYETAGDQAGTSLAFDHAANLFSRVLRLQDHPRDKEQALRTKLAGALADAGRGARAAQEYHRAAELAASGQQLELERSAAFHYCSSGHLQEGMAIFDRVLGRVGLHLSRNHNVAKLKFLLHSLRLHLRGVDFLERPASEVPAKLLAQFDAAWAVAAPMVQVDLLQSLDFGTLCLVLALRAGDPVRLNQATHVGAYLLSPQSRRGRRLAERLAEQSEAWAAQLGDPRMRANAVLSRVGISYICAEWKACCRYCLEAEQIFTQECKGARWELATIWTLYLYALWTLGNFAELAQRSPALLRIAEEREDLYSYSNIEVFCTPIVLLAEDRPEQARAAVANGLERWPYQGFHLQHVMAAHARVWIDFYEGRGAESFSAVQKTLHMLRDNAFHKHPNLHTIWQDHLARSALCIAASGNRSPQDRESALRLAEKISKKLAGSAFPWSSATGTALSGGVAALRGDHERGANFLLRAAADFDTQDMAAYAASARRYAGGLIGGDRGRDLVLEADRWMRGQNVVDPARMAAAHIGGYITNPI